MTAPFSLETLITPSSSAAPLQPPPPPRVTFRRVVAPLRGPGQSPVPSLRVLRRVAAFCRPLRPVLLLVSFPCSRSPVGWCARAVPDVAGCAVCASAAPTPPYFSPGNGLAAAEATTKPFLAFGQSFIFVRVITSPKAKPMEPQPTAPGPSVQFCRGLPPELLDIGLLSFEALRPPMNACMPLARPLLGYAPPGGLPPHRKRAASGARLEGGGGGGGTGSPPPPPPPGRPAYAQLLSP